MLKTAIRSMLLITGVVCCLSFMFQLASCGSTDDPESQLDAQVGPDAYVPVELTWDQLLEACIRLAACEIERHPVTRDCADNYHDVFVTNGRRDLYNKMFSCANSGAGDCKIIRECMGFAGKPLECDKTYAAKCEGEIAHTCDLISNWEQRIDCAEGNLSCGVKDTGEVGNTKTAICGGGMCDQATSANECRANKLYTCVGGAFEVRDCSALDLQCRDPLAGTCEGTGRSCQLGSDQCKGNILVRCAEGYKQEIDCTQLPGQKVCDSLTESCRGAGTECDADEFFDTCEGNTLVTCVDGFKKRYDCLTLGFLGCEKAETYGAYCKAEPVYE